MEDGIFSTNGRISRSTYLLRWICIKIPYWIINFAITVFTLVYLYGSIGSLIMDPISSTMDASNIIMFTSSVMIMITVFSLVVYAIHLALLLPQIAKRLHDMNQSGWWALLVPLGWIIVTVLSLIPVIGTIISLFWSVLKFIFFLILVAYEGTVGDNQYGKDPEQRVSYV
jgi:Predicted membrane protein